MVWYSHLFKNVPQFVVIHTVKGFGIVNKAETDVFLELSCFFDDPTDIVNLLSGSSAFSKSSLNIWKFIVHVLLKPGLENFENYFEHYPSKTIGGVKSHLESNPIPTRDAQRAHTYLVHTRTQRPQRD